MADWDDTKAGFLADYYREYDQDLIDSHLVQARHHLERACQAAAPKIVHKLAEILDSNDAKPSEIIKAAELLLSYGFGRPRQQMEVKGTLNVPTLRVEFTTDFGSESQVLESHECIDVDQ